MSKPSLSEIEGRVIQRQIDQFADARYDAGIEETAALTAAIRAVLAEVNVKTGQVWASSHDDRGVVEVSRILDALAAHLDLS